LQVLIIFIVFIILLYFVVIPTHLPACTHARTRKRTHARDDDRQCRGQSGPHCPHWNEFVYCSSSWHIRFLRTFCFYFSFVSFFILRCKPMFAQDVTRIHHAIGGPLYYYYIIRCDDAFNYWCRRPPHQQTDGDRATVQKRCWGRGGNINNCGRRYKREHVTSIIIIYDIPIDFRFLNVIDALNSLKTAVRQTNHRRADMCGWVPYAFFTAIIIKI